MQFLIIMFINRERYLGALLDMYRGIRVMNKKVCFRLLICLLVGFVANASVATAQTANSFTVQDIRVEGLQRVSPATVFEIMPVKIGDTVTSGSSTSVIRDLYASGLFKDVSIDQRGSDLIINVVENPSIAAISFVGNKEFKDEILNPVAVENKLAPGDVLKSSVLGKFVDALKDQYLNLGKYNASIKTDVKPLSNNRVNVVVDINEGKTASVKKISVIGNQFYSNSQILKRFDSKSKRGLNPFGASNQYSKDKVTGDIEKLRSMYQNAGFADFEVVSSRVSISPKKDGVYLTLNINEGERYKVKQFSLNGRLVVPEAELLPLVSIRPGSYYSQQDVEKTVSAIAERLADEGYAKARVSPVPSFDKNDGSVSYSINVNPGKTVYVRRIEIVGNESTSEDVIRRELRQIEGSSLSPSAVRLSKERLQRLGYFEDVNITSKSVAGQNDAVDLQVNVKELSTGSFTFGLGYSGDDGLIIQTSVAQSNFLGTGKSVRFAADTSGRTDSLSVGYTNPYVTDSGVSRSISFRASRVDSSDGEGDTADFLTEDVGLNVRYRFPLGEHLSWSLGAGVERIDLSTTTESPPEIVQFIEANPENTQGNIFTRLGYDTRDSSIYTTTGVNNRISAEVAFPGSDLEFYKIEASSDYFIPLTERAAFRIGADIAVGGGYGDTSELPFYENYFAGGANSVRGYSSRSLGPRDSSEDQDPLGGDKRVLVGASILLPMPGSEGKSQRLTLFVDGGQAFGSDESIDLSNLRYSAGVGLNWIIPGLGPMSISYGVPLNEEEGDEEDRFQFNVGRVFQ